MDTAIKDRIMADLEAFRLKEAVEGVLLLAHERPELTKEAILISGTYNAYLNDVMQEVDDSKSLDIRRNRLMKSILTFLETASSPRLERQKRIELKQAKVAGLLSSDPDHVRRNISIAISERNLKTAEAIMAFFSNASIPVIKWDFINLPLTKWMVDIPQTVAETDLKQKLMEIQGVEYVQIEPN